VTGGKRGRARSRRGLAWSMGALLVLLVAYPLVGPLPRLAVRALVAANDDWILTNYLDSPGGIAGRLRNTGRKVFVTVAQHHLAAEVASAHRAQEGGGDLRQLLAVLVPLKEAFLNPHEVPHHPSDWPVLLSGLGYCDQVNGAAAMVLAESFPVSQTYNVWDPRRQGHTIGRVWSDEYGDWLYYDLFYDEVVVFRHSERAGLRLLARERPQRIPTAHEGMRGEAYLRFLGYVGSGAPMNEFHATAGGYIASKVVTALKQRTLRSIAPSRVGGAATIGPAAPLLPASGAAPTPPAGAADPVGAGRTRELYLRARLEHLAGSRGRAAALYREAAGAGLRSSDPDARVLGEAALLFLARLSE
jgi:hypothetical protein